MRFMGQKRGETGNDAAAQKSGQPGPSNPFRTVRKIIKWILCLLLACALAFLALLLWLTATEYRPTAVEELEVSREGGTDGKTLSVGDTVRVMTWNIGYGCLGDNADFFMDGGTHVRTADRVRLAENMDAITAEISMQEPDAVLLQEVDSNSARSFGINEAERLMEAFPGMCSTKAANMRVRFLPYPIPPMGRVDSGIMTLSGYEITEAERVQLPVPFKWPVRTANLKRCLMVDRIPVRTEDGEQKELVLVNLHLEAYDSGEGKAAQTAMLRDILEAEAQKGSYVIAGGDFNQTFSNVDDSAYPELEGMWHCGELDAEEFGDGFRLLMDNRVPTCRSLDRPYVNADGTAPAHDPQSFQFYMIDGFIVSENVRVQTLETLHLDFQNSDHEPVLMDVVLE